MTPRTVREMHIQRRYCSEFLPFSQIQIAFKNRIMYFARNKGTGVLLVRCFQAIASQKIQREESQLLLMTAL